MAHSFPVIASVASASLRKIFIGDDFYSFFTYPYLPFILEVERTSVALNADDIR